MVGGFIVDRDVHSHMLNIIAKKTASS